MAAVKQTDLKKRRKDTERKNEAQTENKIKTKQIKGKITKFKGTMVEF